jgi:hypothetical protein
MMGQAGGGGGAYGSFSKDDIQMWASLKLFILRPSSNSLCPRTLNFPGRSIEILVPLKGL